MDNEKIAGELVKIAKELVSGNGFFLLRGKLHL